MNAIQMSAVPNDSRVAETPVVFVIDSNEVERELLAEQIRSAGWSVHTACSAEEFLADPPHVSAGCMVVEQHLSGMSGLDLQLEVTHRLGIPVILMSHFTDVRTTVQAMKAGADEFLERPLSEDVLIRAIDSAIARSKDALLAQARRRNLTDRYQSLTRREREVMAMITRGCLNKLVATELGISEITVKAHRGRVMRKMKAKTFVDLVNMARQVRSIATGTRWHALPANLSIHASA